MIAVRYVALVLGVVLLVVGSQLEMSQRWVRWRDRDVFLCDVGARVGGVGAVMIFLGLWWVIIVDVIVRWWP